jgi:putative transposase
MYHVTARGVVRRTIFFSDDDRRAFMSSLAETITARAWRCHSYCLMGNHYHLLVDTPNSDLPEGMRDLNSAYATRFNTANESDGHVFQGRYHARTVRSDEHALQVARYIPLNPVRAGLCPAPEDWPWSSYRAIAGFVRPPRFLNTSVTLGWFGAGAEAAARYREYVACGTEIVDPEAAALATLLASGRLTDARIAHVEYGYSLRRLASLLGVHHSTLARKFAEMDAPKGV